MRLLGLEQLFELGDTAVLDLGRLGQVTALAGLFEFELGLFELLLGRAHLLDLFFFRVPLGLHRGRFFVEVGDALFDIAKARLRLFVGLTCECLTLDLELQYLAFEHVDLLRQRIDLDTDPRCRLVDQVDRLVRQKAVGDVAV